MPFILWVLKGSFAALWNNQLSELRIGSENTMISNKVMVLFILCCRLGLFDQLVSVAYVYEACRKGDGIEGSISAPLY